MSRRTDLGDNDDYDKAAHNYDGDDVDDDDIYILLLESPCSLVRSLVTKKTRIKVTDHRYMHLSYPHHTHMHRDQGSYI